MRSTAAEIVRSQLGAAAVGALLMIFFGFYHVAEPTGSDLYSKAALVFYHTLRIGGVLMAATAVGLAIGHPVALAADAFVAGLAGLLLIGTGLVMLADGGGGAQSLINFVCGAGFVSSAKHSWHVYRQLSPPHPSSFGLEPQSVGLERSRAIEPERPRRPDPPPPDEPAVPNPPPDSKALRAAPPSEAAPPPEGYLAALSRKDPPPRGT